MVTAATKAAVPAKRARGLAGDDQYLVFTLANEQFAVEVPRLLQIRSWGATTPVPDAPDYVLGKTGLKGAELIVVDLRRRLMMPPASPTGRTLVVVLGFTCNGVFLPVGFTVDSSSGARQLVHQLAAPQPDQYLPVSRDFVLGMAMANSQPVFVLDVDSLVDRLILAGEAALRVPNSGCVH